MFKKSVVMFLSAILLCGIAVNVQAQDYEEVEFTVGLVSEIGQNSLTVIDADESVSITVEVNGQTVFENIESLAGLVSGDEVYVDYVKTDSAFVAVNIFKMIAGEDDYTDGSFEDEGFEYGNDSQELNNESEE